MSKKSRKDDSALEKKRSDKLPPRRIVIIKDDLLESETENNPTFVQLRHPSSGNGATFIFNGDNTKVHEVMQFSDSKRSHFIGETVSSDGDVYFCTPIDPLFLALPYLMKAKRCSPMDQTLIDDEFPDVARLSQCSMDVTLIGDRRGSESLNAFVYNEDKTLLWLQTKVERLIPVLREKTINTSKTISVSANFVKIGEEEDSNANYLRYAYGLLCDYIPEELAGKLADFIKLPPQLERVSKRKEIVSPSKPEGKRYKGEADDYEAKTPILKAEKKTTSAKQQALAKAAKGTKGISSFFKKK